MSTDVSGTSREEVAREVLDHGCRGLTFGPLTTGSVPYGIAIRAMLAFSARERAPVQVDVERVAKAINRANWRTDAIAEERWTDEGVRELMLAQAEAAVAALTPSLQTGWEGERVLNDPPYADRAERYTGLTPSERSPAPSALSVPEK